MDKSAQIKKIIRDIVGADPNHPIKGSVTAIDGHTCSVKLSSGLVVSDVRLTATVPEGNDYCVLTPAIGTEVLMLSGDGTLRDLTVIKMDQMERFEFHQGEFHIEFDSSDQRVRIENGSVNLKDILTGYGNAIKSLTVQVITEGAPSGTPMPPTIAAVQQLEIQVNQLLK